MKTGQSIDVGQLPETEAGVDPQLWEILEAYLAALEAGATPDRTEFLARHPLQASELAGYLPWVELLYQAKPRDSGSSAKWPMPEQLGDFRIVGEIGRGGMGIVYEAEQISLERRVALKVLPFASMLDERQLARFKNEALAAAQLHHPNIVGVFAVGCEHGLHFYVMQLIEGRTLEHVIRQSQKQSADSPVSDSTVRLASAKTHPNLAAPQARLRTFAQWIVQAAEALDHAHSQGIVHRDVKPSNLMVCDRGNLWITDFGLARTRHDASMTASGELLGTLRYMSPEQLARKPAFVDHRTDIYSLGLTLYELVAGRPGFDGESHQDLMRQIEHDEPPPPRRLDPRVPRDLDSIILKAIAKAPEARYASAQEMANDLRRFLEGRPTVARPATWRDHCDKWIRRHARLVASAGLALALVLVCAVVSAVLIWRAQGETEQALALASENRLRAEANLDDARHAVDELFTGAASSLSEIPGAEHVRHEVLHRALAYYRKFAAQAASNPAVRTEKAAAHYRCGQISEQLGDDDAAARAYEEAKKIWSQLTGRGDDDDRLRHLGLCENNLGLIDFRAGRSAGAESHLRAALELEQKRSDARGDDAEARCALALGYSNLGMVVAQQGRGDEARDYVQKALDLQQTAASHSTRARGDLASTYNQLGYLQSSSSLDDSQAAYRRAADEFERLTKDEPRVLRWQAQLATTLNNLAAVAAAREQLDEAEADYRRALNIQSQLAERAPQTVAYARDLAVSQNNLGYLLSRRERHDAAVEQFEAARANLQQLAKTHDQSPEYANRLGAVSNNLGLAFESQKQRERAQEAYHQAVEWQKRALTLSPGWRQAQEYLDAHEANLRRVLAAQDEPEGNGEGENEKKAQQILQSSGNRPQTE